MFCLLICLVSIYTFTLKGYSKDILDFVLPALIILGVIFWLIISIRTLIFKKKLVVFIKRLIAGDYQAGIKLRFKSEDEITRLVNLINKLGDQLRVYDDLRSQNVSLNYRALDIIFTTVKEGLIIADVGKRTLRFNLAAQSIFDVEIENIMFDTMERQTENRQFYELLKDTIERTKYYKKCDVIIKLPIRNLTRKLNITVFPLKDKAENVKLIIIFLSKISDIQPT